MFARVTPYKLKAGERAASIATMETLKAEIMALPGLIQFINVLGPDDSGYVVSVVESQAMSDANQPQVMALWGKMMPHLSGVPTPEGGDVVANWST